MTVAMEGVRPTSRPITTTSRPGAGALSHSGANVLPTSAPVTGNKFAALGEPRRIWVVGSCHGEVEKLQILHDEIGNLFQPGDRLVYLGNFIGIGEKVIETVNELLDFRRAVLAMPGMMATDIVYLRGGQEEMWSKLLQIQFAPNPVEVMNWMLKQGTEPVLLAYRGNPQQGLAAARDGVMAMTRWTSLLRSEVRTRPGHEALFSALRRAAFTGSDVNSRHGQLLFVNAGLDLGKPLSNQGDAFWWGAPNWGLITKPYGHFSKIIRGYDPAHAGSAMTTHTLTIDGGSGFGGPLVGACLTPQGEVIDIIEV